MKNIQDREADRETEVEQWDSKGKGKIRNLRNITIPETTQNNGLFIPYEKLKTGSAETLLYSTDSHNGSLH
jgi:hypothetical protein